MNADKAETPEENPGLIGAPARESAYIAFFCYIVECADGTYYTGWSTDPERRARQHNRGQGARYTRSRLPVRLVYVEECPDRASAMRREIQIKHLGREAKDKLAKRRLLTSAV
jgi:putative endonuclease